MICLDVDGRSINLMVDEAELEQRRAAQPSPEARDADLPARGYRRDYLRALAQRVEIDAKELRIMGSKSELLRTLVAASSAKTAGFGVPSSVPKWRAIRNKTANSYIIEIAV
jgi:hypothetical protein